MSRELTLFERVAFRLAEPRRTMETAQFVFFALLLLLFTMPIAHRPSSFQALHVYFVAATVQQRSHI